MPESGRAVIQAEVAVAQSVALGGGPGRFLPN
jgi:hypothetical protein